MVRLSSSFLRRRLWFFVAIFVASLATQPAAAQSDPPGAQPIRTPADARAMFLASLGTQPAAAQSGPPGAQPIRTPADTRAMLLNVAQGAGMPHELAPNGKLVVHAHAPEHLQALKPIWGDGTGVIAFRVREAGATHPRAIVEGKLLHFISPHGWVLSPWEDKESIDALWIPRRQYRTVLIQLPADMTGNLRRRLDAIFAEQRASGRIQRSLTVPGFFNCVSGWCSMKIGPQGETLAQVLNVPNTTDANQFVRALEASKSPLTAGVVVLGPHPDPHPASPAGLPPSR